MSQSDPSANNKYLAWMAKQVFTNGENMDYVIEAVKNFEQSLGRLKKHKKSTDINSYKSIAEVNEALSKLPRRETPSKKELKGTGELVYENDDLYVIAPRNYEGSCKWGAGAKWCIAQDTYDGHYKNYTKNNLFYFVISKTLPSSSPYYKIAIQKEMASGKNTYWDVPDTSSRTPQNEDITPEVLSIIDKHSVKAKENILKKLVEDMLNGVKSTLTTDNIHKVKDILNDGQLYKIISNDITVLNNNSYGHEKLFNYVLDRLGVDNTLKLLTSDYGSLVKLLANDSILNWVDKNTDRTKKLELADNLKSELKTVSPNIRTKIQKWGMTDEDWEKYNSASQYVYLGDKETGRPIGEIHKVDKFEPGSYDIISQLKLKLKYTDASLYGAVTGKDELDDYLSDGDVPPEIISGIKKQKIA